MTPNLSTDADSVKIPALPSPLSQIQFRRLKLVTSFSIMVSKSFLLIWTSGSEKRSGTLKAKISKEPSS